MVKKTLAVVVILALAILGGLWYSSYQGRPERAMEQFTAAIAEGAIDPAYARLTTELTKGREQYWKDYLGQFKNPQGKPTLVRTEQITDTFNTYTDQNDPRRFTFAFRLEDKTYQLAIITIKEGRIWKVDGLYGSHL